MSEPHAGYGDWLSLKEDHSARERRKKFMHGFAFFLLFFVLSVKPVHAGQIRHEFSYTNEIGMGFVLIPPGFLYGQS